MKEKSKKSRCRYCHPSLEQDENGNFKNEWKCWYNKKETGVKDTNNEKCESCLNFNSKYIEYPINVNKLNNEKIKYENEYIGRLCKINPCGEEYQGKTYLGLYLGDLPLSIYTSYNSETGVLSNSPFSNPAILVPELGKIIFGMESWWGFVENENELKDITNKDIDNIWYVKLLKEMYGKEDN